MSADPLALVQRQIMWDRLIAVVEEQAQTLIRTAFSTSVREAGDLSAGVFDLAGNMLAQAVTGTPGHVNSMARAVGHFLDAFPVATMAAGDVFVTNDPWKGTGHLHDFTMVTPAFRGGSAVALFACTSHVVDVGGRGMGPEGRQVYEEGLYVPPMRFARAGVVDETLVAIVAGNVREPVQVVGDLYSLAACNDVGCRRLVEMMDEFGLDGVGELGADILARSRQATLDAIRALPRGTFRASLKADGYDRPLDLVAAVTIGETGIDVDFTGTSPPSSYGINVPFCYTEAYAAFGIKCMVAPSVPNNAGSLSVIRVTAPEDCILNAKHPLPVATRHVTGQLLPDLMFGCLAQAMPGRVPAEGTSVLWNLFALGGPGVVDADPADLAGSSTFNVMSFHSGGTGARPGKDGLSATAFPSGVRNVPIEITEAMSPILVWRKEYRPDSGGAGEYRGGLGQILEAENLEDVPFAISANYDRVLFAPRGRDGGGDGAKGIVSLAGGPRLKGKGRQTIPRGARLVIEMPGGGGLGDPRQRAVELVRADVRAGLVTRESARADYRVALDEDGAIDVAETARLRAQGNS